MDTAKAFKAYDIRGIFPDEIDQELAYRLGRAFVALDQMRTVLVARDMRASSEPLSTAFMSGAMEQGADVVDLGLASTDLLYYASGVKGLPGVVFTASHNPAEYNGIKLCRAGAVPVGQDTGLGDLRALVDSNLFPEPARLGRLTNEDLLSSYAEHLLGQVDADDIGSLKIVVDAANGMGGLTVPAVLGRLDLEIVPMFFELDGTFPNHPADPIQPENLAALQAKVVEVEAACGLAFDGDADRVFFVDEKGETVNASLLGAMVAEAILRKNPGEKVVYSLTCSRVVPETIERAGGTPIRTRVGHSFIKQVMADTGAIFGTEHSGHFYFRDHFRADCGMLAALHALAVIGRAGSFSEALAPYRTTWHSGEINSTVTDAQAAIEEISRVYSDAKQDRTDGLTVEYEDWWFSLRASNTEPLLRLNLEHSDPEEGPKRRDEVLSIIRS
ncbi:MAG: phosphomannomutase/phosphoglucomutase [Actinomycetota bacterium]